MSGDLKLWWSPTVGLIRGIGNGGHDDAMRLVLDDPAHEVECPSCSATIRARMSDTTPDDLRQTRERAFADGRLAERASPSPGPLDRIQSDPDGTVDEIVWTGTAHFEMSTDTSGYLHLTRGDAAVFLRVWADGGRLVVREEWRDGEIGDEEDDRG